jgi:hypothetical protein
MNRKRDSCPPVRLGPGGDYTHDWPTPRTPPNSQLQPPDDHDGGTELVAYMVLAIVFIAGIVTGILIF